MTFWSSQKLELELSTLITPYNADKIEQASYTLGIGNEVFVTKDHRNHDSQHTKWKLAPNQSFVIPAGQFAFLLTEETIKVPKNAIAFISMKAGFKHKGLVNISGFHVDPGFNGKLLFSVYNAGPIPITLSRNEDCFLIWYASLDHEDSKPREGQGYISIPSKVLSHIATSEIYSLQALTSEFRELDIKVEKEITEIKDIREKTEAIRISANRWVNFLKVVSVGLFIFLLSVATYFSTSIIGIAKFAIEQREVLNHLIEYKDLLDEQLKQKNRSQQPVNAEEESKITTEHK